MFRSFFVLCFSSCFRSFFLSPCATYKKKKFHISGGLFKFLREAINWVLFSNREHHVNWGWSDLCRNYYNFSTINNFSYFFSFIWSFDPPPFFSYIPSRPVLPGEKDKECHINRLSQLKGWSWEKERTIFILNPIKSASLRSFLPHFCGS